MKLSVVICTHNPPRDRMERVLSSLQAQKLPRAEWELVVVDNACREALVSALCLDWHPAARVVREERAGLTPARLCGIAATTAPVLVFVDDDNLLRPDYLATALGLAERWPILGAWGGQIVPRYAGNPDPELRKHLDRYFSRKLERAAWSNVDPDTRSTPVGAGMCVRREVAEHYRALVEGNPLRLALDRTGASLSSCGDLDLAWTSLDVGLGTGLFPELVLEHEIEAGRVSIDYLLRLEEGIACSDRLLRYARGMTWFEPGRAERLFALYRRWRLPRVERRFEEARLAGRRRAQRQIDALRR